MIDTQNKELLTFEESIRNKDAKTVSAMINKNNFIVSSKNTKGELFLNIAISTDLQIAKLLVDNGADVNRIDKLGFSPIYNLIKNISIFLQNNVDSEEVMQIFQLFLSKGAQLTTQDRRGNTPINYIAQHAKAPKTTNDLHTKIGKLLLAFDKNVSNTIQIKNNMGKSPLDYLSRNGNFILRDAVFSKLPHVQDAISRTIAETEEATKKMMETTEKILS